jgi:hypothetical protein
LKNGGIAFFGAPLGANLSSALMMVQKIEQSTNRVSLGPRRPQQLIQNPGIPTPFCPSDSTNYITTSPELIDQETTTATFRRMCVRIRAIGNHNIQPCDGNGGVTPIHSGAVQDGSLAMFPVMLAALDFLLVYPQSKHFLLNTFVANPSLGDHIS